MITTKPIYHNLARCNICGIPAKSAQLYNVVLDNETGKACSVHTIELCKPCMHKLGKTLLSDSKEQI